MNSYPLSVSNTERGQVYMEIAKAQDKRIDMMYKQKRFFRAIFDTEIGAGGNLKDNQYIRLFQAKDDYSKVQFFNNIDDLVYYVSSNKRYGINTYFNLSLTNGVGGTEQDLRTRTVIALDFDKKDLGQDFNHVDIINKFKSLKLWYHALVDSGNGYHAYICIEPTRDIDKVVEVTKAIGNKLGADLQAMKSTQILRVPYTFNVKDPTRQKQVNIIKIYPLDTIKRFNIDDLYSWHCMNEKDKQEGTGDKVTQFTIASTNIPPCIEKMIVEGSEKGKRYEDLQKIVVTLRDRNKTLGEIKALVREWAGKSDYKDNTDYRVEHIYNNLKYVSLDCKGCKHSKTCFTRIESDFNYPDDQPILTMTESHTRYLKASNRKGARKMLSNDLMIYGILKNHSDGLFRAEIEKELTYRNTICLSKPTLTKALQSLEDNGFIEVTTEDKGKKFYKIKEIRSNIELTYNISYAATYEAVKGNISTEELRLYQYMRYLHNKQQREDSKALKGNLFQFNQVDLAKDLGLTQGRVSQMISNLLFEKLISIWYRQPSQNNGFDYNIYRLNY